MNNHKNRDIIISSIKEVNLTSSFIYWIQSFLQNMTLPSTIKGDTSNLIHVLLSKSTIDERQHQVIKVVQ